jgi:hypothetical protein
MLQQYDFSIVSREDRGHWLASELRAKGFKVALIELGKKLGRWAPEDLEGPFGMMRSPRLHAKQWSMYSEGHITKETDRGFCIWLKDKALELIGPLYPYQRSLHSELEKAEDYFADADGAPPEQVQLINEKLNQKNFNETWPIHLGHNFSANVFLPNASSIRPRRPFPLFYNYSYRETSRYSNEQALLRLEEQGVEVFRDAVLRDISINNQQIEGLEVQSGSLSQFVRSNQWLWLLGSEETHFHNESLYNSLFKVDYVASEWSWVRFRLRVHKVDVLDELPDQFLMIEDLHLPWVHENFIQVLRNASDNEFDFWARIPSLERFRKEYLESLQRKIWNIFKGRVPGLDLVKNYMPAEYHYSYEDLGPSPFALFDEKALHKWQQPKWKNFHFDGPETYSRWDAGHRLMKQQRNFDQWVQLEVSSDSPLYKARNGAHMDAGKSI